MNTARFRTFYLLVVALAVSSTRADTGATPPASGVAGFTISHSGTTDVALWGISEGGGKLVAVGSQGTILVSNGGDHWARPISPTTEWLLGTTYGNGIYVVVGDHGTILTSSDAQTWSVEHDTATSERLNNVVFGDGRFVAVGDAGSIITSTDAVSWTKVLSWPGAWFRGLAYNPEAKTTINGQTFGYQFIVGGSNDALVSSDGVHWSSWWLGVNMASTPPVSEIEAFLSLKANGAYVGVGSAGWLGKIDPADKYVLDFTRINIPSTVRFRGVAEGTDELYVMGEHGVVLASHGPEGQWVEIETPTRVNLLAGLFSGNSLYVVGENETILRSTPQHSNRLVNISTRGFAATGESTLISGFVVNGTGQKRVLVRGIGPGLKSNFGLADAVSAPKLEVFNGKGQSLAVTTDWRTVANKDEVVSTSAKVGAFPLKDVDGDAAMILTLDAGIYTAQVSPQNGQPGTSLIEVYDADEIDTAVTRAVNISTRAEVKGGDNIVIAGFVLAGSTPRRLLIRGAGPTLKTKFNLQTALALPRLALYSSKGTLLQSAAAWSQRPDLAEIRTATARTGAFAFDEGSNDAAMVVTLQPGIYTVQLTGANSSTGVGLIEVYDLP